jgi:hypothetical protein
MRNLSKEVDMREILFRGKANYGEWFVGFYVHIPCGRGNIDEHLIQTVKEDGRIGRLIQVISETVGQFTGLCDKNGKKIFEGDIVSIRFEGDAEPPSNPPVWYETAEVFFSNEFLVWGCRFTDGLEMHLAEYNDCDAFVIGNIHDNPELLEVDNGN